MKFWKDIDPELLESLLNSGSSFETRIDIPEFTMLGVKNQPDFGKIRIWFYANEKIIELKSLKIYLSQFRNIIVSYERLLDVIYTDLSDTYAPSRLRIEIAFRPRGGISSTLVKDSDWKILGGTDEMWRDESRPMLNYEI